MHRAKKLIHALAHLDVLGEASAGMYEDWFWTGCTIWPEVKDEDKELHLEPCTSSTWATPCLWITYKDGTERVFECYTDDTPEEERDRLSEQVTAQTKSVFWAGGCLSGPVQDNIPELEPYPDNVPELK